jgi:hypothetical protein
MTTDTKPKPKAAKRRPAAWPMCEEHHKRMSVDHIVKFHTEASQGPTPEGPEAQKIIEANRPGTIIGKGTGAPWKVPYTRKWIEENYEMVDYEPERGGQVIFEGIKFVVRGGESNRVPSIVRDVLRQSSGQLRDGHRPRQEGDQVFQLLGQGPLEEEAVHEV